MYLFMIGLSLEYCIELADTNRLCIIFFAVFLYKRYEYSCWYTVTLEIIIKPLNFIINTLFDILLATANCWASATSTIALVHCCTKTPVGWEAERSKFYNNLLLYELTHVCLCQRLNYAIRISKILASLWSCLTLNR